MKSVMSMHLCHCIIGFSLGQNHLIVQRREVASKPLPYGKTQEERENEEINLINILNPGERRLVVGGAA